MKANTQKLCDIKIPRCLRKKGCMKIEHISLHYFSDESGTGYGAVVSIRSVRENSEIFCNTVTAKPRVAPLKFMSVPRFELTAAVLALKTAVQLREELDMEVHDKVFWTGSRVVLGYIQNTKKRFKTFVANRIHQIKSHTDVLQWQYIPTKENPADDCSRGLEMKHNKNVKRWFQGPEFLSRPPTAWCEERLQYDIAEDDVEVKMTMRVNAISKEDDILTVLESRISSWKKMKRVMAYVMMFIQRLKQRIENGTSYQDDSLNVKGINDAANTIMALVQQKAFNEDIKVISKNASQKECNPLKSKTLQELKPFINENGLVCVGGRLQKSSLDLESKHPIILPKNSRISLLIVRDCHDRVAHGGRGATLQEIRNSGIWIINCNRLVRHVIYNCVKCRSMRGRFGQQIIADLPKDRVNEAPPFTYCGIDLFGPFIVKERRSEMKRYGALFTCLASRAVHIEVVASMETDSFIMALRRVIARRGNIRTIRSDNGSNFIGAEKELSKAFNEMDHTKISNFLQGNGTDWLVWIKNTPTASHMGGVWERQIRSARNILSSLLKTHGRSLNDEALSTLMAEVEAVMNSRPLTVELLSDGNSLNPISPSNLLTMKSKIVMPPPGEFGRAKR